jgi:hypothetical protein
MSAVRVIRKLFSDLGRVESQAFFYLRHVYVKFKKRAHFDLCFKTIFTSNLHRKFFSKPDKSWFKSRTLKLECKVEENNTINMSKDFSSFSVSIAVVFVLRFHLEMREKKTALVSNIT